MDYPKLNTAQEIAAQEFDRMRGRILGLLEAASLETGQERAIKTLFKSLSYDCQGIVNGLLEDRSPDPFRKQERDR
jgi:hypothetical protein